VRLLNGKPGTAAELVRYTNIEKKYGVVYWSIGNEPNLYEAQHQGPYDTVTFNKQWRAIALAMKAVDPTIKLMGPETSQWNSSLSTTPKDSAGRDWMTEFLKANGDLVDVVTVHRYPMYSPTNGPVTVQQLRDDTRTWLAQIDYLNSLVFQITGKHLPQAWTEVNSDPSSAMFNPASPDSFYNAIWYADVLGQMLTGKAFMVNQWVISQRGGGLGLLNGTDIRPTFYVFPLYRNFGSEQVFAASGVPDVDIFAAKRPDGALTLMVINLSDAGQSIPLKIQGSHPTDANVWLLDATHNAVNMGLHSFPDAGSLTLPPQSASLYIFNP
jgi:alpha-L-arabinofuranosidase